MQGDGSTGHPPEDARRERTDESMLTDKGGQLEKPKNLTGMMPKYERAMREYSS